MKITCKLGRIAPVEIEPKATLKGERNSKRWILDIEYEGVESVTVPVKLLDYGTGKALPPKGLLNPTYVALNRSAARAAVFFPIVEDDKLFVVIEPARLLDVLESPPPASMPGREPIHIRVTVDAVHTLMR